MNHNAQCKEPIAIIGMGCRFPGQASDPNKFWDLLCRGVDAIIDVPNDRWDIRRFYDSHINTPGKMIAKRGGFLKEKWDEFDAEFFHISPREAKLLDPQQRLLLEIAWEAMEDGGVIPESLRGTSGGVYIGAFTADWLTLQNSPYNRHYCEMYTGVNSSKTILSARLSHFFDLKGPCLSVDTACSSSLVAVHLACQSIWNNECSFALAGGVNAMLAPETSIAMSKGHFLNPDSECRSFDADAKGYVRGEGGGIVILKPLSAAIKDKNLIYAVICGTGVNQDGYTQGGITQPNSESQRALIQKVLEDNGIRASDIHYVEAHGTGTPLGDPAEALAIDQVLNASKNRLNYCYLGSVKSNIGHLEAAAGIAGLIKAVLCLQHKKIPPNLHFKNPNPNIPFDKYCLRVPTKLEEFPQSNSTHLALVNAFGYGGTNANVALQSYEQIQNKQTASSLSYIFPFSAKNSEDLGETAVVCEKFLRENPEIQMADIAHTLAFKRSKFDYRLSISSQSIQELVEKLRLAGKGEIPEGCVKGKVISKTPLLAFVYTGMGPQWWGMARDLLENSPIFLKTIKECDRILHSIADWSILEELQKAETHSCMAQAEVGQIANYSIQAALTDLLKSWGIQPDFIIGHSIGEVGAAYAAGSLTLEEGLRVSFHRSRLQATRKHLGAMLATGLSPVDAQALLINFQGKISIAAENSQSSVTLSGSKKELEEIAEYLEKKEIYNRFLKVNIAYHSHQMDGLEEDIYCALDSLSPKKPSIPFYSTVYGGIYNELLTKDYWWQNIRKPVLFAAALEKIINNGCQLFLEIGPHPVLGAYIKETLQHSHIKGETLATLNRKKIDRISLQECVGGLFVNGYTLPWDLINRDSGNFIRLPTYPWRKKSHWIESEESRQYRLGSREEVMLSRKINSPSPTWQVEINRHYFPWLEDHKIEGIVVFPAAAYVEAGLEIFSATQGKTQCCLEEIIFHQLLTIPQQKEPILQISLDTENQIFKVHSLSAVNEKEWVCHASGKCRATISTESLVSIDLKELQQGDSIEGQTIYQQFAEKGLEYGTQFQGIKKLWKKGREALAEIHIQNDSGQYQLHPSLLDAAFQTLIGTFEQGISDEGVIVPCQIEQIIFYTSSKGSLYCHAKNTKQSHLHILGDLVICDGLGNVCVQIKGLKCQVISQNSTQTVERLFYDPVWIEKPLNNQNSTNGSWLIGADEEQLCHRIKESLMNSDYSCSLFSLFQLETQDRADRLIDAFSEEENLNIVLGYVCDVPIHELATAEFHVVCACINLVKAIENLRKDKQTSLWIITKGTQFVDKNCSTSNSFGSSLWGLARVIRHELSNTYCSIIDLDNDQDIAQLVHELKYSKDIEIALRQKTRYAFKIERIESNKSSELMKQIPLSSPQQAFSLELKTPGKIDSLFYKEIERHLPSDHEVGIQIHTSSLNFKDLMKILGMLNQNALEGTFFGTNFGMECTGTIVSVGKKVKNYRIGDLICAFTPHAFQSYVTLSTQFICSILPNCTLDNSAIYVPFITVLRALKEIGKLKKDETILIHSASGAVGLAAIQYSRFVGARIFATAGSEEKRAYLKEMGVQECSDSRTLSFGNDILKWTDGKGVDVILNSLGGDALIKSWSLLAPYGRFLEIGKKDISINSKLPMKDFDRNTLFASIDLDRIFLDHPQIIQRLIKKAFSLFNKGVFQSLPCKSFPANESIEAFHYMARAKQVGKIMLKFANQTVMANPRTQSCFIDSNSSYLITGGLSGFGLIAAKWLVEKGAKHLILLGRSGASSKESQTVLNQLTERGISINVASVDVGNFDEMTLLFNTCHKSMPPVKGVLHCAMVLNDAFLSHQTVDSIQQVLYPKIAGCINLHRLTVNLQLDFFVLFSSVSSIIGNPGQGNYAAANSFLDSFCHYRKSQGLSATTINWGALKTGALSRNTKLVEHLANHGIMGIPAKVTLQALEKAIFESRSHLCVLDIDWKKLMDSLPGIKEAFAFADFRFKNSDFSVLPFFEELLVMDTDQRLSVVITKVKHMVSETLKMDPAKISITIRLNILGIDSLMTMELLAALETNLGVKVPTMELMKGPTIEQLAQLILRLLDLNRNGISS